MVDFVDLNVAQGLGSRLDNFRIKATNPYRINFRCPLCGDSEKSRSKSRGWLLERDNSFFYYCHNCGASHNFGNFLKLIDILAYNSWVADKFIKQPSEKKTILETKFEQPAFKKKNPLKNIKKVSQLHHDHGAISYIKRRQIPTNQHYRIYYAPNFKAWINEILPDKFPNVEKDESRLVFPFLDEDGEIFGVSARSLDPNTTLRYITIMFEEKPKIFGVDKVDFNKQYFVVEGAIDSFFIDNAVAMAGADGNTRGLKKLENAVFVFDAEPRNREIHMRMEKVIAGGHSICIWPSNLDGKDINEMVLNGTGDVENIMRHNIHKGLQAKLKFTEWRKR